jgi:hypothetical protein
VIYAATFTVSLPGLTTIWLSPRIAAAVAANRPCPDSVLASASFSEPSLVYLVGQHTRLVTPAETADHLKDNPGCALALVSARDEDAFMARAQADGLSPHALTRIDGINYSTGKRLALTLYGAATSPPAQ